MNVMTKHKLVIIKPYTFLSLIRNLTSQIYYKENVLYFFPPSCLHAVNSWEKMQYFSCQINTTVGVKRERNMDTLKDEETGSQTRLLLSVCCCILSYFFSFFFFYLSYLSIALSPHGGKNTREKLSLA